MKITILAFGSRGDVQPFLALAVGLKQAGHSVRMAVPAIFADWVDSHDISSVRLPGDIETISRQFNNAGRNPYRIIRSISEQVFSIAPEIIHHAVPACRNSDCIIHGFLFTAGGHTIAHELDLPDISIQLFPMFAPTRAFPNVSVTGLPSGCASLASHQLFDAIFHYGSKIGYARIIKKHPNILMPPALVWPFNTSGHIPSMPLVFAFSPKVVPWQREWLRIPFLHMPGFFILKEDTKNIPKPLTEFMNNGSPPVCITFGSMINKQMDRIGKAVFEALQVTHERAVIITNWGEWKLGMADQDKVITVESLPHEWIFPRSKFIIHHGGAGTTAAALRSGVPNMAIPLAGDQPFWAKRIDALGVGPASIPVRNLSADNLAAAIGMATNSFYIGNAKEIDLILGKENGVKSAVTLIEEHVTTFRQEKHRIQP